MLELKNVTKIFYPGSVNEKVALNGLSLHVRKNDFITVIGGNGSGKSTMMNIITGVFRPEAGRILLDGKDITELAEFRRAEYFGRVFQDPMMGTAPEMAIEENLALAHRRGKRRGLRWGIGAKEREMYRTLLADLDLGLEGRMTSKVGLLSGGQRQALTLLMATLARPKMLLLDEHTAALDPRTAAKVLETTDRIVRRGGLTALMVTHNMRDAIDYGNRLIMLSDGRVVLDIEGEEKSRLTVTDLLARFSSVSGAEFASDRELLN